MDSSRLFFALSVLAGVLSASARAQSYGNEEQVLTIGAAEFRPVSSSDPYLGADGYLHYNGDDYFRASVSLPEGSSIQRMSVRRRLRPRACRRRLPRGVDAGARG
jgi:hypothetical protein